MIKEITVRELFCEYVEEVCFSEEAKAEGASINRNNPNAYIPGKYLDPKKIRYAVNRAVYKDILTSINSKIALAIINENYYFNMPFRLGGIEIVKSKPIVIVDDSGKVINTFPPDWNATLKLWEQDPIAKKKKKLIRHLNPKTDGYVFKIRYKKTNANYANKKIYNFKAGKSFTNLLAKCVKENPKLDFYLKK